ncbi:hypothetical protein Psi02_33860 [Planotetraspora silvatica]|uniref:Uncharacterized protein n=1 Tax=Planotetraspora silvatica TaxID=234614 RepID=A0A8J3UNF7_9ACTN|nr:hypothetical protein [Planotetraspora silvatica]GII46962.1 hypothetical protein Psi02_33860 [Planotetraspora silvatica]
MVTDETWALIAPRPSRTRRTAVAASILLVMAVLAVTAWWAGAVVPRLSVTPTLVEPGGPAGSVRLHVWVRNEGLVRTEPWSISPGTTLPVRAVEPHAPDAGGELLSLPGEAETLPGGAGRPLILDLQVPCGPEPPDGSLEMVVYGPRGGHEIRLAWKDGRLPDWRHRVVEAACARSGG